MNKFLTLVLILIVGFSIFWLARWESAPEDLPDATAHDVDTEEAASEEPAVGGSDEKVVVVVEDGEMSIEGGEILALDTENSFFRFTGYAVGKSHVGDFKNMKAEILVKDGTMRGGSLTLDATSVVTDTPPVDRHLKSDDFFIAETYPEIVFTSTGMEQKEGTTWEVTGVLDFIGKKKSITFPVEVTKKGIVADFKLDVSYFDMAYVGVDKDVRIEAVVALK